MENIHSYINKTQEESINILKKLAAQPSISAQNVGVKECAKILYNIMTDIGIDTRIFETKTQPIIFGEIKSKNQNSITLLFYGHYDVQPPDPLEEWNSPPFEPTVFNKRLYGRGTADNKGQLLTHILAVRSFINTVGYLPINIKFVFEGEEESGSTSLPEFVKEHRNMLNADLVYTSDGPRNENGAPVIEFGVRGVLSLEITLQTAKNDNHSGNKGGVIPNAAWKLIDILSLMKDSKDNITINGFYDNIIPPSKYDLKLLDELPYNPNKLAKIFGVQKLTLDRKEFYRRLMFEPTLTINGLRSGYTGVGTKTIIPGYAVAKMDARLVCNQDPNDIFNKIKDCVINYDPCVKVIKHDYMYPSRTSVDLPVCKSVIRAVNKTNDQKAILIPVAGGSLPDYVWTSILGVPSLIVPYANADESNHAPNENIVLDYYLNGIHTSAQLIHELQTQK